jgi:uncharacterized repeat protein (TIGR03833 family)
VAVPSKKNVVVTGASGALTHSPFAKLAELPVASKPLPQAVVRAPVATSKPVKAPPPCRVRMRLETTGRSGKAVTRVEGLPEENIEAIAARLRKGLGCSATLEGPDLLLIGSLLERAQQWFDKAGDLRAIVDDKPPPKPAVSSEPAAAASGGLPSRLSPMRRCDIRRGQRVAIVTKLDQPTGNLTHGTVRDLLTNTDVHPRGIKVRLETGEIGRVQIIYD